MVKKVAKKQKGKKAGANKNSNRLGPGKKQCKNCPKILPIHTKKCTQCGFQHDMKKNKAEIMKSLNKITPIIIKSIIQNNDFNEFKGWKHEHHKYSLGDLKPNKKQPEVPISLNTRRSSTSKKKNMVENNLNTFSQANRAQFQILNCSNPITCLSASNSYFVSVESIRKTPQQQTPNETMTIKSYGLQNFHCMGINYEGESLLKVFEDDELGAEIVIEKHILKIKMFSNIIAALTGQSTIIIFSFDMAKNQKSKKKSSNNEKQEYRVANILQIREAFPDKITAFQWLRGSVNDKSILISVGTLFGHISIYEIYLRDHDINGQSLEQEYSLLRYIPKAHFEHITCISQCPLNNDNSLMFASGCYDGSIKIWDVFQNKRILECNTTNRKIEQIFWDPGAKFLLVVKDQLFENLVLICFYSINKIEETVFLSSSAEIRTIKKHFPQHLHNCKIIISQQSYDTKYLGLLDAVSGYFRILSLEELRSTSLKKKKARQSKQSKLGYLLKIENKNVEIKTIQGDEQEENESQQLNRISNNNSGEELIKKFPQFCDIIGVNNWRRGVKGKQVSKCVFYIAAYEGLIVKYDHRETQ